MKNGTDSPKNLKQLAILAGISTEVLYSIFDDADTDYYIAHKAEFRKRISELKRKLPVMGDYFNLRTEEQQFWKEYFKWNVDFGRVFIPPKPEIGSWLLLTQAQGMTNNKMFARMEQLFKCWRYSDDLDVAVPTNARTTENHYAVWVRDGVEPDAEFLGKSTREADPDMKIGVTLLERNTLEVKYYAKTGKHLDIVGGTRCSASLDSDGNVPNVYWNPDDGAVDVCWRGVGRSYDKWGIRRAVYS
ncbi:MAG: hypothetical protein HYT94_02350 [Parcubacteria group bacterium]|nr:hypothetical protein [Parcubacteria group bacterium]